MCDGGSCGGGEALYYPNSDGLQEAPIEKQRKNGGGRACAGRFKGAGGGTESTALPNELEWPIETVLFFYFYRRSQKGLSVKTRPSSSSFAGAKCHLLTQ